MTSSPKKPLLRWTMGPSSQIGTDLLKTSVKLIRNIYGERLDYVICVNGLDGEQMRSCRSLNIEIVQQSECCELPFSPMGVAWKLYPPRLRLDSHEIFIDNDLILWESPPGLEQFLAGRASFLYTEGLHRAFGRYSKNVPEGYKINTGLFGIPPNFDFASHLRAAIELEGATSWEDKFDEQGVVASILSSQPEQICLRLSEVAIAEPNHHFKAAKCGCHFVQANVSQKHLAWDEYVLPIPFL